MHVIHDQPDAQLAVLVQRLGSPDAGIALEAVQALHRRLSTSNDLTATVAQLYAAGAAAALPRLLSSSDQALQCAVLQLLSFVAKHRKQKDPALEAALADELHAAVPALLGIFQRGQHSVHSAEAASVQAVGSLLCDLARLPSLWLAMAEHGAVAAAARQLQLGLLVPQAAGLLAKLARPAPGRQAVVTDGRLAAQQRRAAVAAGAIPALVQRLEAGGASHAAAGGSEEVQQAAWALANLCQWCPEGQAAARREHTLPRLMHLAVHLSWQHGDSPDLPPLLAALASSNDWRHMERHGLPSCLRRLAASSNRTTRHRAAALLRWMEDASGADGYSSPDDLPPQQPPPQPPTPQQAQPPTKQQRPQLRLPQQAQPPPQQQAQPQPQQDAPPSTAGGRRRWRNRRRASQGATAGQVSAQAAGSSHLRAEQPRTAVPAPAAGTGRGTLGSRQAANAADSGADESDQLLYEMLASFGVGGAPAASGPTAAAAAAAAAAAVEQPASEPPASSRPTAAAAAVEQPVPAPAVAQAPATPAAAPVPAPAAAGCTADQPSGAHVGGTAAGLDPALLADLACPLTLELMHDPVVAADGCTYERAAIAAWIARQRVAGRPPCSPLTNAPLSHLELNENRLARSMIASLKAAGLLRP